MISQSKKTNPNKANLLDAQMNISSILTKDYNNEQRTMNDYAKQTQSNPIKPKKLIPACRDSG